MKTRELIECLEFLSELREKTDDERRMYKYNRDCLVRAEEEYYTEEDKKDWEEDLKTYYNAIRNKEKEINIINMIIKTVLESEGHKNA